MIHLIPAWYHLNTWNEHEQFWYKVKEHTEFDDTVKQLQMFHRNRIEPYEILLLGHAPNFRHFLHRQGVLHASYWSCFDSIQQIKRRQASTFSFHDLSWPEDAEFEYTPFVIVVYLKGIRYAQIEFGEDGNMILIWIYKEGNLDRCNIYDDRGFISKTVVYENGICLYQDYLMEDGTRKFRLFVDGHVEINERCPVYSIDSGSEEKSIVLRKLPTPVWEKWFRRYLNNMWPVSPALTAIALGFIRITMGLFMKSFPADSSSSLSSAAEWVTL